MVGTYDKIHVTYDKFYGGMTEGKGMNIGIWQTPHAYDKFDGDIDKIANLYTQFHGQLGLFNTEKAFPSFHKFW